MLFLQGEDLSWEGHFLEIEKWKTNNNILWGYHFVIIIFKFLLLKILMLLFKIF